MKKIWILILGICLLLGTCTSCKQEGQQTEPSPTSDNSEPSAVTGGVQHCEVHDEQYHEFLSGLTDPLDPGEFEKWSDAALEASQEVESDCPYSKRNMKTFIDYFQIPRETFEEYCNSRWSSLHNIDLLYSDDMETIETYYRDVEKRQITRLKQENLRFIKTHIINNHTDEQHMADKSEEEKAAILKEVEPLPDVVSTLRLIQLFQVEKAELDDIIKEAYEWFYVPDHNYQYDYQFDLAYNEDGTLKDFTIDPDKTVVELDAQFAGVDNFFTD
ncbi:MAG: hypothetical protein HFE78_05950 [Clostridiales bacterium]|nr:hypothetical protein [Clostridiales bacterium]